MPIALQLLVALRPEDHEPFQRALLDDGLIDQLVAPCDPGAIVQQLDLPTEEVLFRLTTALRRHGVDRGQVRRFWRATPKELNAAELLWMFPWIHASGRRGPRPEREYDCSAACPTCGAGLRPLGPLRLRRGEVPRTGRLDSVSRRVLAQAADLGVRHEHFGTGELCEPLARSRLAGRRIIARPRVYRVCRRLKLRGIRFSPVGLA